MYHLKRLVENIFYDNSEELEGTNGTLEFAYKEESPMELESNFEQLKKLLKEIGITNVVDYKNTLKVTIICKVKDMEKAKDIAKSLGYRLTNELTADPENKTGIRN
jgi:transcriptional/translational regulatory protein YebC/TACO1